MIVVNICNGKQSTVVYMCVGSLHAEQPSLDECVCVMGAFNEDKSKIRQQSTVFEM